MASILDNTLANVIYKSLKSLFYDATLIRDSVAPTSPDTPFDPSVVTTTSYTCKAIVETYSDYYRLNDLVQANDRRVIILTKSLTITPLPGDRMTIRGQTFSIINVTADPALATWECQGRIA